MRQSIELSRKGYRFCISWSHCAGLPFKLYSKMVRLSFYTRKLYVFWGRVQLESIQPVAEAVAFGVEVVFVVFALADLDGDDFGDL